MAMIDVTKTGIAVRKKLVVPINLSMRVTGAFYAVYGGAAQIKLWQVAEAGHGSDANLFACLILGAFALFGLALCLTVENLTFDPATLTYEYRKGFGPFVKSIRGSVGDIRAIAIERTIRTHSDGEATPGTPTAVLSVRIEWNDGRKPIELFGTSEEALFGSNRAKVQAKAERFATSLGVRIDDRSF